MAEFCFWANVLLRGLFKSGQGRGCFIPKTLQGLHFFYFLEHSVGSYFFELFPCETNLKKKSQKRVDFKMFQDFCSSDLENGCWFYSLKKCLVTVFAKSLVILVDIIYKILMKGNDGLYIFLTQILFSFFYREPKL